MSARDGSDPLLNVEVHGPAVTEDTAREVGERTAELLDAVSEAMGGPKLGIKVTGVLFKCDSCERTQPCDAPRDGWQHHDGDDYCPACVAAGCSSPESGTGA